MSIGDFNFFLSELKQINSNNLILLNFISDSFIDVSMIHHSYLVVQKRVFLKFEDTKTLKTLKL